MKVVVVSFFYDERLVSEEDFLRQNYTITGWAEALQRRGLEVALITRFPKEASLMKNQVSYYFVKDRLGGTFGARQLPLRFLKKVSKLDADVIHLHNLSLSPQTRLLRFMLPRKTAMIVQHHGGKSPGMIKRSLHNLLNAVVDGYFFTAFEQGREWLMSKRSFHKIMPVMEGATFFDYDKRDRDRHYRYTSRDEAREKSGLAGNPVFLWVGRLDANKDPLVLLGGFELLLDRQPNARLYMIFSEEKLLNEVKTKIGGSSLLTNCVSLLGKIPHEEMKLYYNSADYFVLGSHYEGSGYALSEALSCGCIPVITQIPSFKAMTDNGRLGALWAPGDKSSFAEAALQAMSKPLKEEAEACIHFFRENLSFDGIAKTAERHYREVMARRLEKQERKT